jgi:hypothetical protein
MFIKRKLMATIAVVSSVASLHIAGRFAGDELITHPCTMTHGVAALAENICDRSVGACSADSAVLNANASRCFESKSAHLPTLVFSTQARMDGKS